MARLIFRVLIALVAAVAGTGAGCLAGAAQGSGALVNGVSICPPNLDGAAINAADCVDPAANVGFYVANPNTGNVAFGSTGGDGLVSFPLDQFAISPDGAEVEVGVILGSDPYGAVSGYAVGCTRNGEAMELEYVNGKVQPGGATLGVRFMARSGDQVACEWFLSHVADDGGADTGDQPGRGPIVSLPTTGTGSAPGGGDVALPGGLSLLALAAGMVALIASRRERAAERWSGSRHGCVVGADRPDPSRRRGSGACPDPSAPGPRRDTAPVPKDQPGGRAAATSCSAVLLVTGVAPVSSRG